MLSRLAAPSIPTFPSLARSEVHQLLVAHTSTELALVADGGQHISIRALGIHTSAVVRHLTHRHPISIATPSTRHRSRIPTRQDLVPSTRAHVAVAGHAHLTLPHCLASIPPLAAPDRTRERPCTPCRRSHASCGRHAEPGRTICTCTSCASPASPPASSTHCDASQHARSRRGHSGSKASERQPSAFQTTRTSNICVVCTPYISRSTRSPAFRPPSQAQITPVNRFFGVIGGLSARSEAPVPPSA